MSADDLSHLDAQLEGLLDADRIVTLTLAIGDKRYGSQITLDQGFPARYADEQFAIYQEALTVAGIAFRAFTEHFTEEDGAPA